MSPTVIAAPVVSRYMTIHDNECMSQTPVQHLWLLLSSDQWDVSRSDDALSKAYPSLPLVPFSFPIIWIVRSIDLQQHPRDGRAGVRSGSQYCERSN